MIAAANQPGITTSGRQVRPRLAEWSDGSIWTEVHAWVALLPVLFIAANGRIGTDSGPVAFRFTAMQEDSLARRMTRLGCSLLILFLLSTRFREIVRVCGRAKLLLLLPGLAFISALWSQNPIHTLVDAANLALTTVFAIYLYVRYPGRRLVEFMVFATTISLLLCIFLVLFVPSAGIDAFQQNAWRGIFGQRNNCAIVCTLFLVLGLMYRARSFTDQIARATVIFLSLLFIVMSGSRTGWALTALALALTFGLQLISRMRSLDRVVFLMAAAVPTALLVFFVATNFNELLSLIDRDPTMTQRTVIWAEVFPSIVRRPFQGYGYSSYWAGLNGESMHTVLATGWMEGQAQDGYLDVLLELGLIGLLPLVWLFVRGFAHFTRTLERKTAGPVVLLAAALLPLILAENIGESSLLTPLGIPWFFALLSFLILAFARNSAEAI